MGGRSDSTMTQSFWRIFLRMMGHANDIFAGTQSRLADIYFPCWKRGRPAVLDVTIILTMQQLTVRSAAENQGHALFVT